MSREIGPADVSAYRAIRKHAVHLGIDVLHGHGAKGGAYARLVARSLRRTRHPAVCCYTPHGGSLHYHPSSLQGRIYMLTGAAPCRPHRRADLRERVFG